MHDLAYGNRTRPHVSGTNDQSETLSVYLFHARALSFVPKIPQTRAPLIFFSLSSSIDARSMLPNRKVSPPESFSPKVKKKIDKCSSSGKRAKLSKKIEKYEEMRGEGRMMCNAGSIHPKPERVYERVENRENEKKREKGGRNVSAIHSLGLVSPTLATALIKRVINIRPAVTGGRDIILWRLPFRHQSQSVTRPTRRRGLLSNRVDRSFRS